jgi:hypothetical protein
MIQTSVTLVASPAVDPTRRYSSRRFLVSKRALKTVREIRILSSAHGYYVFCIDSTLIAGRPVEELRKDAGIK